MIYSRLSAVILASSLLACPAKEDPSTDSDGSGSTSDPTTNDTGDENKTCEDLEFVTCSGKCVDVDNDPAHCGMCGQACNENEVCWKGECINSCTEGLTRCFFEVEEMSMHACVSLQTDLNHCGHCNNLCETPPDGTVACTAGTCEISCNPGFAPKQGLACVACDDLTPLASNPTAFWRLNEPENETSAMDASGNNINGTYIDMQERVFPGVTVDGDTAARFGSTISGRMKVENFSFDPDPQNLTSNAISIEFWLKRFAKPLFTNFYDSIFSYAATVDNNFIADELMILVQSANFPDNNHLFIEIGNQLLDTGIFIAPDQQWNHVVFTWDSSSGAVQIFINGKIKSAPNLTLKANYKITNGGTLVLGQDQNNQNEQFVHAKALLGALDEVAVYPFALNAAEVASHFNSTFCSN